MNRTYINAIGTANPKHKIAQNQIASFMAKALALSPNEQRKLNVIYQSSAIEYRYSVLADYAKTSDFDFYPNLDLPFPSTAQRMNIFEAEACPLAIQAIENCFETLENQRIKEITHLITVSCTGMYAPGLDIELVEQLGLDTSVQRTCMNFMGCYAAFNALKMADAICKSDAEAKVLVVAVELCTLHFQQSKEDDDLIANAIFGDGAAAVFLESQPNPKGSLALEAFYCDLAPRGKKDMAWHIQDSGFEMRLSSYVPEILQEKIGELVDKLLSKLNLQIQDIDIFALHPGGRRILESIEKTLHISKEMNSFAYQVLRDYGNMSSVTVLYVLKKIMDNISNHQNKQKILSMAFGPGLTLESALLKICFE